MPIVQGGKLLVIYSKGQILYSFLDFLLCWHHQLNCRRQGKTHGIGRVTNQIDRSLAHISRAVKITSFSEILPVMQKMMCLVPAIRIWPHGLMTVGFSSEVIAERLCTDTDLAKLSALIRFSTSLFNAVKSGARFSKVPLTLRAQNQIFKSKYKE